MTQKSLSEFIKRLIILVVGLTIAHLGVTLFLLSNLCSDPFNVLIQGISNVLPLSHGTCHQIICFLILGCFILAFGMTIVIKSNAGTGPNDLVGVVLSDKTKKPFGLCRVIVDFSFVIIGVLLGGIFGVGTIVCAFLIGPIADRFLPVSEKLVYKLLNK